MYHSRKFCWLSFQAFLWCRESNFMLTCDVVQRVIYNTLHYFVVCCRYECLQVAIWLLKSSTASLNVTWTSSSTHSVKTALSRKVSVARMTVIAPTISHKEACHPPPTQQNQSSSLNISCKRFRSFHRNIYRALSFAVAMQCACVVIHLYVSVHRCIPSLPVPAISMTFILCCSTSITSQFTSHQSVSV